MSLIIFLIVLSLLVLFHECGHFFAARFFGIKVEEFGFGFPPRAIGIKRGDMTYSINWVPLGGFVKIKGENGESANDPDSFGAKPVWQRAIVLVAGVFMNLVLTYLLLWGVFFSGVPMAVESIPKGVQVRNRALVIQEVLPGSPADRAGLKVGERVILVNDTPITTFPDFTRAIPADRASSVELLVANGSERSVLVTTQEMTLGDKKKYGIGVALLETGTASYGFFGSFAQAGRATWNMTTGTVKAFGDMFGSLFTGKGLGQDVSGPVGIVFMTGQVARLGFVHLLQFAAILSVNLAILNILPFPALDGGRLLFVIISKIRGRRVAAEVENTIHMIGFFLLILFVLFVTWKDLARYGGTIVDGAKSMIGL